MRAIELRNTKVNFSLACHVFESQIDIESLTELTDSELRVLLSRTEDESLIFEIRRLIKEED